MIPRLNETDFLGSIEEVGVRRVSGEEAVLPPQRGGKVGTRTHKDTDVGSILACKELLYLRQNSRSLRCGVCPGPSVIHWKLANVLTHLLTGTNRFSPSPVTVNGRPRTSVIRDETKQTPFRKKG